MNSQKPMSQEPKLTEDEASAQLLKAQIVALPTETVYGLAGRIDSEKALKAIFTTKRRPLFDPLIVHVKDLEQALGLASWDPMSLELAKRFWPGPLTLVLKKREGQVSDLITHGGDTVALRCPQHPLFLRVLEKVQIPLAAPSANMFGQTSPTQADHVINEFHGQIPVLDGGPCSGGIESTVVQAFTEEKRLQILRPGLIDKDELGLALNQLNPHWNIQQKSDKQAPGFLKNHYQPHVPLILIHPHPRKLGDRSYLPLIHDFVEKSQQPITSWQLPEVASLAARQLYADLRRMSPLGKAIAFEIPPHWSCAHSWQAILDRLLKASHAQVHWDGEWRLYPKT